MSKLNTTHLFALLLTVSTLFISKRSCAQDTAKGLPQSMMDIINAYTSDIPIKYVVYDDTTIIKMSNGSYAMVLTSHGDIVQFEPDTIPVKNNSSTYIIDYCVTLTPDNSDSLEFALQIESHIGLPAPYENRNSPLETFYMGLPEEYQNDEWLMLPNVSKQYNRYR